MIPLLLLFVAVWTWAGIAMRTNLDRPGDMVEAYVWGQSLQWGYFKHPPLSAWIAGTWFRAVPEGHFGYALLCALNAAAGLAGLAVLARRLLPADWALLCVAAATLTPGVTTMAMRFNANAVLVPTWLWAMALFVRLMQDGRRRDAIGCGLLCALAVLGKYYSGVLLLTLLASALIVPTWRRRFATGLPWLAIGVALLALLPHIVWLAAQTDGPLQYAREAAGRPPEKAEMRALRFALAQLAFPALALGLLAGALGPRGRGAAIWAAVTAPLRPRREPAWLLAMLPIVLTVTATLVTGARTSTVWGMPIPLGLTLLAVCRAQARGATIDFGRARRILVASWVLVILLAPALWWVEARQGDDAAGEPRAELAAALDQDWRREFGTPLRWVSGTRVLAASTAFYADDHPGYWSLWGPAHETPWVDLKRVRAEGSVIVCAEDDRECQDAAARMSSRSTELEVAKHARGFRFAPRRYRVVVIAPGATGP
ncbi:MAG: glycosyltransferase family 39 protein [Burkholderiales bacterium]|nr:glycosyltransferase family 39 protein [Burkholderiales bacterium]